MWSCNLGKIGKSMAQLFARGTSIKNNMWNGYTMWERERDQ